MARKNPIADSNAKPLTIDQLPRLNDEDREAAESGYVALEGVPVGDAPAAECNAGTASGLILAGLAVFDCYVDTVPDERAKDRYVLWAARDKFEEAYEIVQMLPSSLRSVASAAPASEDLYLPRFLKHWQELSTDKRCEVIGYAMALANPLPAKPKPDASAVDTDEQPGAALAVELQKVLTDISRAVELARATTASVVGALFHANVGITDEAASVLREHVDNALCEQLEKLDAIIQGAQEAA